MRFDSTKRLRNISQAGTEALLDRVTVFREGMELEAVELIVAELARRGFGPEEIAEHDRAYRLRVVLGPDGLASGCSFCDRAAVEERTGWQRLLGLVPIFRRTFYYCDRHAAKGPTPDDSQGKP